MGSFQVKIVGDFCNLRCSYCRNRDFDQEAKTKMSLKTLEKLFVFLNSLPQKRVRVNWHGGEPLLIGKEFFKRIVEIEKQYPNKQWVNAVQTNATLVDHEWARFFSANQFRIGVSVDGNEEIHNHNRVNTAGQGTYQEVIRGVNILRKHNIYPGTICTITKEMVQNAREILLGLVDAGFKGIAFNAFYNTASENTEDEYGLSDKEWLMFLIEIFETWLTLNDPEIRIREIDSILAWTRMKSSNSCVYKGNCHQWFAVDDIGSFYPCERFGKEVRFGDLISLDTFQKLITSATFLKWKSVLDVLPEKCRICHLKPLCNNGCGRHRHEDAGEPPLYTYCESRKSLYHYIQERLKQKGGDERA